MSCLARVVQLEDHALTLPEHPEDGSDQRVGRQVVLAAIGVADHDTLARPRVVRLYDSLHRCGSSYRDGVGDATGRGEFAAIERIAARFADGLAPGEVWIGDDAAVVNIGPGVVVVATDAVVDGVHADLTLTSIADLGWKALAVNISDLAAMGCVAVRALVTVSGPPDTDLDGLYDGLAEASAVLGCPIVGGDLTSAPRLVVNVAVLGDGAVTPPPVLRSGAHPGDEIWITGTLGGAAAGLRLLRGGGADADPVGADLVRAHARPTPRVAEGVAARQLGATAMIDVSDGFAADLGHVLSTSGVGCELDVLPIRAGALREEALGGGEDYELVWCCRPDAGVADGFARRGLRAPILLGRCVTDADHRVLEGAAMPSAGWTHPIG